MVWYDGGELPPKEVLDQLPKVKDDKGQSRHYTSAALVMGEKGMLYSPGDYGGTPKHTGVIVDGEFTAQRRIIRPRDGEDSPFSEFKNTEFVRSPGHFVEFANAIKGEGKTVSNFPDYAGPLSETILLGNLAVWSGKKVNWDAEKMIAEGADEKVQRMIRHEYENGYSIHEGAMSAG